MKTSNTAKQIANLLAGQFSSIPKDALLQTAQKFVSEMETENLMERALNTAPTVPASVPPDEKTYPSRKELKPTPVSVPDPAETEDLEERKKSSPEYARFANGMLNLSKAADSVFEIISGENEPESEDKRDKRSAALDAVEEVRSSIYGL